MMVRNASVSDSRYIRILHVAALVAPPVQNCNPMVLKGYVLVIQGILGTRDKVVLKTWMKSILEISVDSTSAADGKSSPAGWLPGAGQPR